MDRFAGVATLTGLLLGGGARAAGTPRQQEDPAPSRLVVPLAEGRLPVRDLIERACREAGVAPGAWLEGVTWSIDVRSTVGRLQLGAVKHVTDGAIDVQVDDESLTVLVQREEFQARAREGAEAVQAWFGRALRDAGVAHRRVYGLTRVTVADPRCPLAAEERPGERVVVLIHGLDDPGWMWDDLTPRLLDAGYTVARFEYRNDGPVGESADGLAAALADLRARGVAHVDIIAHSMGGLVARDVLTRPAYYNGDGACGARGDARFPAADRLIMLGTPNQGAPIVRLRAFLELREQFERMLGRGGGAPDPDGDGGGEAGIDLLPGSDFLRRLNARPPAAHTRHTIVAGRLSPLNEQQLAGLIEQLRSMAGSEGAPAWLRDAANGHGTRQLAAMLAGAARGLGDGCVSLDSARLEGVDDFHVVHANHMTMIVNPLPRDEVPPAIPIVLETLAR